MHTSPTHLHPPSSPCLPSLSPPPEFTSCENQQHPPPPLLRAQRKRPGAPLSDRNKQLTTRDNRRHCLLMIRSDPLLPSPWHRTATACALRRPALPCRVQVPAPAGQPEPMSRSLPSSCVELGSDGSTTVHDEPPYRERSDDGVMRVHYGYGEGPDIPLGVDGEGPDGLLQEVRGERREGEWRGGQWRRALTH